MKKLDIKDQQFNMLKVLDFAFLGKQNRTWWKCICQCGNVVEIQGRNLTSGNTKSCGCNRRQNLTGKQFGKIKVLKFSHKDKNKHLYWVCRCSCGKEKTIRANNLRTLDTTSCGCQQYSTKRYEKFKRTCLKKYGVDNPTKNPKISLKAAKTANQITDLTHWLSQETVPCRGSYEIAVVNYFNKNKIDYLWQVQTFLMPDGRTYTPDCYLPDENKWIEIKGYFWGDAKEKWDWFYINYPDSELWNQQKLKKMEILV